MAEAWEAVHFCVPTVYPNDGIGGHVERMANAQRQRGRNSEIFVEARHPDTAATCHLVSSLDKHIDRSDNTVLVYQSGGGSNLPAILAAREEALIVQHHGITPVDLVAPWSKESIGPLTLGRRQLEFLATRADLGVGTSDHTADELRDAGFSRVTVAPVMIDDTHWPQPGIRQPARPVSATPTVLFVGRITPNKAQHDLIEALAVLREAIPTARLRLVGTSTTDTYRRAIDKLVSSLGLESDVDFVGAISDSQLIDEYHAADVFCSLSDHEGFGMPLIEAAAHRLPVVAYAAGAVADTVGNAGIMLRTKPPELVATALERVLTDSKTRDRLVEAGTLRSLEFSQASVGAKFEACLTALGADVQSRRNESGVAQ
jgi:glycosyltransferase involved in cell wall biosynthesis